jgi:peptidoglycan-associated lipoprotein
MKVKHSLSVMVLVVIGLLVLYGCPKKAEVSSAPESAAVEKPSAAESAAAKAAEEERAAAAARAAREKAAAEQAAAEAAARPQPVYFDFDMAVIRTDGQSVMKANAAWLKAHPKAKVRIEGNCDERGTIEYNQALGQRRSVIAKKYLVDLGIAAHRITLLSYGKEKPVCMASTEECWQKNRRDDFVVVNE